MKAKFVVTSMALVAFVSAYGYEWRYSDDMQEHINSVNRDLQTARLEATAVQFRDLSAVRQ